jgi:hypothetical protein
VRRAHFLTSVVLAVAALALTLAACDGGDDDDARTKPAPAAAPDGPATPRSSPAQLPPRFVKCMADQGFEVKSSADIHSAPPEVLQACFGSLHGG